MLQLLTAVIGMLITILIVVGVHEFGHFCIARLMGVKVIRFSIGFGKALYRWHDKSGTEYILAMLPFGGYVKLLDENEEPVASADLPYAYNHQPFYKKFAIVAAGPIFNLILAFVIYWGLFVHGFNTPTPVIGNIIPHSIAAQAGMKSDEKIVEIDTLPTKSWVAIIINLLSHAGDKDKINITTQNIATHKMQNYSLNVSTWKMDDLKPDPLSTLGIIPFSPIIPTIIDKIAPDSPAIGLLEKGDKILALNNKKMDTWFDLLDEVKRRPDTQLNFKVLRAGNILVIPVKSSHQRDLFLKKQGYLGLMSQSHFPDYLIQLNKYDPLIALSYAWQDTLAFCHLNFMVFGKLFTGKISVGSLGGPITIFQSAGVALNSGLIPFFSFLAFLSISIGLVNVLPIPGLDGGLALLLVIEFIIRRPIPIALQNLLYRLGLILLVLLISQSLLNDILRL